MAFWARRLVMFLHLRGDSYQKKPPAPKISGNLDLGIYIFSRDRLYPSSFSRYQHFGTPDVAFGDHVCTTQLTILWNMPLEMFCLLLVVLFYLALYLIVQPRTMAAIAGGGFKAGPTKKGTMYVCIYIYIYVCIHNIYIYIYIYTYM